MCGVIGMMQVEADLDLVRRLFDETQIRGKHATGVSYVKEGKIQTIKEPLPVAEFFEEHNPEEWVDTDGGLTMIGHIRYSTSDLRYNQPFSNSEYAIAHNGVITQEPKETWEYRTETANDSELILHAHAEGKLHPLQKYHDRSMAVVGLDVTGDEPKLFLYRNHKRPLWQCDDLQKNVIVTSTKDIALRSGLGYLDPLSVPKFFHLEALRSGGTRIFGGHVILDENGKHYGYVDLQR